MFDGPKDERLTPFQPIKIKARGGSCPARDESQYRGGSIKMGSFSEQDRKFFSKGAIVSMILVHFDTRERFSILEIVQFDSIDSKRCRRNNEIIERVLTRDFFARIVNLIRLYQ